MDRILGVVTKAPQTRSQNDDDFADRLSSRYTVVQLVAFALLVGFTQYVGKPITCWAPVHFTGAHVKFANSYCWVKNTYYLPWTDRVPSKDEEPRQMIPYYQWISFILLTQAVLFYMPSLIWHGLNSKAGVDADNIMAAAHTFSRTDRVENRERTLKMVVNQIDRFLHSRRQRRKQILCCDGYRCSRECLMSCSQPCGRRIGNYLLILFLVSKIFYIGNVIGQLFLLNSVLATKYNTLGADIVRNMIDGHDWTEDSYVAFPRVTMCDFKVRGQDMVNVHPYTVQCVLPINLYNEKIYVYLWYWMVFVAAASCLSFLIWLIRMLIPMDRKRFVRTHIADRLVSLDSDQAKARALSDFAGNYLQQDGVFLLRLIAHNTNGITTTEIASAIYDLWKEWKDAHEEQSSKAIEAGETASLTPRKDRSGSIDS